MEELSKTEIFQTIVSLQMGIIPVFMDINEELSKMSPDEARKVKRKYRKLRRQMQKIYPKAGKTYINDRIRGVVDREAFTLMRK